MTRMRAVTTVEESWGCRCKPKPYVLATFRNQELISVTRMHNRCKPNGSPGRCGLPPEQLDPRDWDGRR